MKTKIKSFSALIMTLVLVFGALFAFDTPKNETKTNADNATVVSAMSGETESVVIASAEGTKFQLYFSSDKFAADQVLATSIGNAVYDIFKQRLLAKPDSANDEGAYEILIGDTNRAASKEFGETVRSHAPLEEDLVWGYAYKDGKLLFWANNSDAFELGSVEFLQYLVDNNFTVASDLSVIKLKTRAEYDAEIEADKELQYKKRIEALIAENAKFTQSDFGGAPLEMSTERYKNPPYYPADNQHPRLFFTADKIDEIYDNLMNDPNMEEVKKRLLEYANSENFTGIFPEVYGEKTGTYYRFDVNVLAQMEARALLYALTGDEIYGYEAIIGAKNAMISLHYTTDLHMDVYHGASQVMVNVAKVYDWCYDLLSEDDKNQIIAGVSNILAPQMESGMRFPPSGMNAVSGHGTGPQFTRDWVTISLAFYDEMPSWWDFVGGRYFEQYVPVIDYCYQGGYASQGTTTYGDSKYFTKGWAAWLIQTATGEFPYVENFHLGAYYYFSHMQPNGYYFQTGDGGRSWRGCGIDPGFMFISAALFQDPVIANMAREYSGNYKKFSYSFTMEYTVCDVLIFYTYGPDIDEYDEEDFEIDLIQFLDFPSGTMTARNSWDEDAVAVLMRIANMTMANHDLNDHGTFQIYYKGLLAGTSGAYNKYGSYVHKYYLQSTVAHNGLLIFDPSLSDAEPKYATDADGNEDITKILNVSRYYYSGSQRARGEAGTIENWLSGEYNMAETYGADWGYDLESGAAKFAYIAGDLTQAYPSATAKYMGRKMLTVFTGDPDYPMFFFTYDQMTSTEGGENFRKTFLLHTVKEPVIDTENLTAVITQLEGRLYVHSVSGAQKIAKVGGPGYAYWINNATYENEDGTLSGKNCWNDGYTTNDNAATIWGRMELTATGNLSDSFLTAMYVTDATNDTPLEVTKISSDTVDGAKIGNQVAIFTKSDINSQQYKEFSFSTEGNGLFEYYVAGVEAGTWNVKVDDVAVAWSYSETGGHILTFVAPAGDVTITPGKDVIGANGGKIKYNSFGATLPDDTPYSYNNEMITPLPTDVKRGADLFLGWYTSPTYEKDTLITEIPMGLTGTLTLYARFLSTLIDADFTDKDFSINVEETTQSDIVNFSGKDKAGSSFKTKTDENDVQYLEWIEGSQDPLINYSSQTSNYATMSTEDECATFTITMAKDGDNTMMATQFRIYTKKTVSGGSATTRQYIFTTNTNGEVRLGDSISGPLVTTLTSEATTLRFVMDFKNEEIRAFDDFGTLLATCPVSVKATSGAANMSEWRTLLDSIIFYWYGASPADANASMRIYGIKIEESDRVASAVPEDGSIVYGVNGGTLPSDAPRTFSTEAPTKLPIPTKENASFAGWYTTSTFENGTEIEEIPVDTEGYVSVYAKWQNVILNEDFSGVEVNAQEKNTALQSGLQLNADKCTGASFITKTDENGTPYLEWIKGENDPRIIMTKGNIATSSLPAISYELVVGANADDPLMSFTFRTLSKVDVGGNKLAKNNQLYMFGVMSDGAYLSTNGSNSFRIDETGKFAEFKDGKITLRVVLDFENCRILAYRDDGTIATSPIVIPESSGATNGIEYMRTFTDYVLYMYSAGTAESAMRVYSVKVVEGNIFGDGIIDDGTSGDTGEDDTNDDCKIIYNTNGGTLPSGAPLEYSKDSATVLPTPTKANATFDGWYTSDSFDEDTRITEIPAGTEGDVTVYAKWLGAVIYEDYSETEIDVFESSATKNSIKYNGGNAENPRTNASFKTETDGSGNKYLVWTKGDKDPIISINNGAIAAMTENSVSYEISFSRNKDAQFMPTGVRTMAQYDKNGAKLSDSAKIYLFSTDSEGNVYLGQKITSPIGKVADDGSVFTTRLVIDFDALKVLAYLEDGTVLSQDISIPEGLGITTGAEYKELMTTYVLYWQCAASSLPEGNTASIRVNGIKIYEGNMFAN